MLLAEVLFTPVLALPPLLQLHILHTHLYAF
jgi:hypothetical protein